MNHLPLFSHRSLPQPRRNVRHNTESYHVRARCSCTTQRAQTWQINTKQPTNKHVMKTSRTDPATTAHAPHQPFPVLAIDKSQHQAPDPKKRDRSSLHTRQDRKTSTTPVVMTVQMMESTQAIAWHCCFESERCNTVRLWHKQAQNTTTIEPQRPLRAQSRK